MFVRMVCVLSLKEATGRFLRIIHAICFFGCSSCLPEVFENEIKAETYIMIEICF